MAMARVPHLTKSRYLAGLQCPKRLWLESHEPDLAAAPDAATASRLEMGAEIGRRAQTLFPGGVLVEEAPWHHAEAVARTQRLLGDRTVPAVFEAAFEHAGVRIRVDVLERLPGGAWGIREVKSAASVKEVHIHDVAVQTLVLEGSGLRVPSAELIHVNTAYARGDHGIDWPQLFARADVTAAVAAIVRDTAGRAEELHRILALAHAPAVEPAWHCHSPHACEFWEHCTRDKPADWVFGLPRLRASRYEELQAMGIERIPDIPDDFPLKETQARVREVLRSGREFVSPHLVRALEGLGPPTDYLDFEALSPPIPPYPGTRPYERIPFQWSLQRLDGAGQVTSLDFLADGRTDPRRDLAESLLAATGDGKYPIVVYSDFEDGVLRDLAGVLPDLAERLDAVRARLADLLPVVRRCVYHPAFGGSFSLKRVAPALVPGFAYADLQDISDGSDAAAAFLAIVNGTAGTDEDRIRTALLTYCRRDTTAILRLHRALAARS